MNYITKAISIIFHPLFVPLFAFFLYLQIEHHTVAIMYSLKEEGFWAICSAVVMFTCIMPLLSLNMMKNAHMVSDWEVSNHKERVPVLISSALFLCCLYYVFSYLEENSGSIFESFYSVLMGGIVLAVLGAGISYFWKISLHSMMIAGLAGAMIGLTTTLSPILNLEEMVFYNSLILLTVGIVAFARLHQKAHNILQVLGGMALGFSVEFLVVNNGWYF